MQIGNPDGSIGVIIHNQTFNSVLQASGALSMTAKPELIEYSPLAKAIELFLHGHDHG